MRGTTAFYVRDDDTVWARLAYEPESKRFELRLDKTLDYKNAPITLSAFADAGMYELDGEWSLRWVQERIIPSERANIGEILKARGLSEYDEFQMLISAGGRCMQDDLYLEEIGV